MCHVKASILALIFVWATALWLPVTHAASGTVLLFEAELDVSKDGTLVVEERITYDFGSQERHGIFRVIPYSYQATTDTYTADVSAVTVSDDAGNAIPFTESRDSGELTVKIGDPDVMVAGVKTYVLSYVVDGPFLFFDDRDELYWNATGLWTVPIERARVVVALPYGSPVLDAACYAGPQDSKDACETAEKLISDERAVYRAEAAALQPESGLTIAVAFPSGTVENRSQGYESRLPWYRYALPFAVPLVLAAAMAALWYRRGRDPKGQGTIVTEFEPPQNIPPSVAGVLYNERLDAREFTAEVVRLAVEGHMRIHRFEEKVLWTITRTEYLFERTEGKSTPDAVQQVLLDELFASEFIGSHHSEEKTLEGALLSRMKQKFAPRKKKVTDRIYEEVEARALFLVRPDRVRGIYGGAGLGVALLLGAIAFLVHDEILRGTIIAAAILSGLSVALWGLFMPVRTREGVQILEHLKGFRTYLSVALKDRLAFHNAPERVVPVTQQNEPERTPELFDRFLPYAIAFGVESAWAGQFADLHLPERDWYVGGGTNFSSIALASELSSFGHDFAAASVPQGSGSSGGGSVGGGFGGGRGGSW